MFWIVNVEARNPTSACFGLSMLGFAKRLTNLLFGLNLVEFSAIGKEFGLYRIPAA